MLPLVIICFSILIALGSGCAPQKAQPAPPPVVILPTLCPRPMPPALPKLAGVALLESRQGYAILKLRDQKMRDYIKGLNTTLDCYDGQTQKLQEDTHEPQ